MASRRTVWVKLWGMCRGQMSETSFQQVKLHLPLLKHQNPQLPTSPHSLLLPTSQTHYQHPISSPRDHLTCHQPELPAYHTYSGEKRDGEAQTAEPNVISPRVLKACASQLRGVLHHLSNPSLHLRESQCYVQWSTED